MRGKVVALNYLGAATRITVDADGQRINAVVASGGKLPAPGDDVTLTFNRDAVHLMEGEA